MVIVSFLLYRVHIPDTFKVKDHCVTCLSYHRLAEFRRSPDQHAEDYLYVATNMRVKDDMSDPSTGPSVGAQSSGAAPLTRVIYSSSEAP